MKRLTRPWTTATLLAFAVPGAATCDRTDREGAGPPAVVARGEYLVNGLLQCFLCHSERDWDRPGAPPAEGRAGAGVVTWSDSAGHQLVAHNLTPDAETGIGRWTDAQLERAIRHGIGHDGRVLSRRMWYNAFRHLTDGDVAAVITYLRSRAPVHNPLPPTVLPPALQARIDSEPASVLKPVDLSSPDPVEVGRGLVLLADCAGCHTAWEAPVNPGLLGGGNAISRAGRTAFSTNISPHSTGVAYDADAFIAVIRTGKQGGLDPLMPWIVFRNLRDADLRAIHAFLQTREPVAHYINNRAPPTRCVMCGQKHGLGDRNRHEPATGVALDPATLSRYAGRFRSPEYGWEYEILIDRGRLMLSDDGEAPVVLVPRSPTRFLVPGGIERLRVIFGPSGRAVRLIAEDIEEFPMERVGGR